MRRGHDHRMRGRWGQKHASRGMTVRYVEPTASTPVLAEDLRRALRAGALTLAEATAEMDRRRRAAAA
jgi:hypothetical protein